MNTILIVLGITTLRIQVINISNIYMISKEDLVKAGAENLSDILISIYKNNPALQKQLDISFAGLNENPKQFIYAIEKKF